MLKPGLIVADEPVSALDVSVAAQILNLFRDLNKRLGLALLFISHNLETVHYLCDRVAVMRNGKLVPGTLPGTQFNGLILSKQCGIDIPPNISGPDFPPGT